MAASSAGLHEDEHKLQVATIDRHRAITSIMEELEAVDWYDQRVDAATDEELKGILAHNRDEEKEHAVMALEWLRRRDPKLDEHLRTYLFTTKSVLEIEDEQKGQEVGSPAPSGNTSATGTGDLGIGSLREGNSA